MPKKFETVREVEISKDYPEAPRYKKGEVHYMHKDIAAKLKKAGVTKSVSEYDRKGAIEREKKEIATLKRKQKELNDQANS